MAKNQTPAKKTAASNQNVQDMTPKGEAVNADTGEITTTDASGNAPAVYVPKLKRIITKPLIKAIENKVNYFRIDGAMFVGKEINEGAGKAKKEPATLMYVTDLETRVEGQYIVGSVLKSILEEEYPNGSYVGLCFAFKKHKIPGKQYNGYDVAEIEA